MGPARLDPIDTDKVYGQVAPAAEDASDVMNLRKPPMEELMEEKAGAIYRSSKREALGKGYDYGARLPAGVKEGTVVLGKPSAIAEGSKQLIYPADSSDIHTDAELKRQHVISHGAFEPGEQRKHGVAWEGTRRDPIKSRFGVVARKPEKNGVGKCLDASEDDEAIITRLIPIQVAAAREFSHDHLGRTRNRGQDPYGRPPPDRFGIVKRATDGSTAADCIRGDYDEADRRPDDSVGKATRPGYRNIPHDPARVYGIPSLRTDVPPRKQQSLASKENFGQDVDVKYLVTPSRFMSRSVDHSDFVETRDSRTIRDIFARIGRSFSDSEFAAVFRRAQDHYDVSDVGTVSVEEFRQAMNELDDAREEGREPEWMGSGLAAQGEAEGSAAASRGV